MICPRCGTAILAGRKFCTSCGAALLFCANCGNVNLRGWRFCGECGGELGGAAATGAAGDAAARAPLAVAERRHLTVMFCDLVGSTALSERLDPEDLRSVIDAFQNCCAEIVLRFEGIVAKYTGDGLLACFGYPHAHEDDAERAVRGGLGIVEAVRRLKPRSDLVLQVRIGIATGLVVVGDIVESGSAREQPVIGETPNLAARLQALAEPDTVVISAATRRLIGGLFRCEDLGLHALKGFSAPAPAWRVRGESRGRSRFEAMRGGGFLPLIGREAEIELLERLWHKARSGEGQVVLMSGEAGMGKSRVVQVLRERLHQLHRDASFRITYHCAPYHQNTAFRPMIELIEQAARLSANDPPEGRLAKLSRLLARSGNDRPEAVQLLAHLLSIPGEAPVAPSDPERQRAQIMALLLGHVAGLAARRPVLANFEDIGLMDPSTLELVGQMVARAARLPMMIVLAFRPSFVPPWTGPHFTALQLGRLDRQQAIALIHAATGGKPLPPAIVEQIVARTDGVPLFIEEVTRAALDSGQLREEQSGYRLAAPLSSLAIPTTLYDSLMARLDRLAAAKEVAQIAAAIGREFPYDLLAATAPLDEAALTAALDQLVQAEIVHRHGPIPGALYSFRHALVQDAAHASLLRSRRRKLHARIARVLEEKFPARAEAEPERLANHCVEAGMADRAVTYWRKAAQQAVEKSATAEAITHLSKGLLLLEQVEASDYRHRRELDFRLALGNQLMAARGPSAPETGAAYGRARDLCRQLGDPPELFAALYGTGGYHFGRAELHQSRAISEELLQFAERHHNHAGRLTGHRILGADLFMLGEFLQARLHLEQALALYDPGLHRALRFVYAHDSKVVSAMYLAWTDYVLGYSQRAARLCRVTLAEARKLGHPHSFAYALDSACYFHQLARDRQEVKRHSSALLSLSVQQDFAFWRAQAEMYRGWALADGDDTGVGMVALRAGIAQHQGIGSEISVPYHLAMLAEMQSKTGDTDAALASLAEAVERTERSSERWFEAELHRRHAEVALRGRRIEPAEAEALLRRALSIARLQSARTWELRAASDLARLWRDQGRAAEARSMLAPLLGWFSGGASAEDLRSTTDLLADLGER